MISDENIPFELCGNIIPVKSIHEIEKVPFFSVCIPSTNRGDTIYRALNSVANQKNRDFEVIVVDCESEDNTVAEIERFYLSDDYQKNKFRFRFIRKNYKPLGTEDWNEPVRLSSGRYIAMLEGDDYWLPDHLENAFVAISENPNIGLYGSSNTYSKRHFQGLLPNQKAKEYCYTLRGSAVPPSESIFIRCDSNQKIFKYNSELYKYSPEIGLYVDIVLKGHDLFYSQKQDVYREPSTNKDKMKTWYYFEDRFTLIEQYKNYYSGTAVVKAKLYNAFVVETYAVDTKSVEKGFDLIRKLKERIGIPITITSLCLFSFKVFYKVITMIPRRIARKIVSKGA